MLFDYSYKIKVKKVEPDRRMALFQAKKMLPEYVFDTSQLENNPITFPEVQTLIDGVTIGGHKISDVQQVLNIKESWEYLLSEIQAERFTVSKKSFHKLNGLIARDEALEWGKFRTGQVGIAGTDRYKAPDWRELESIFDSELLEVLGNYEPIEQAVHVFLWGALNQFYWDGNKRTARLMASGILIHAGIGVFNIRAADILEFNTLMLYFYNTRQADDIVRFLSEKCIRYIDE